MLEEDPREEVNMQTVAVFKHWVIYYQRWILAESPALSSTKVW